MPLPTPPGYVRQDEASLPARLAACGPVAQRLGGRPSDWRVEEIGDGNLNLVFRVRGPAGGVVVKQALPHFRLVGESWPLPLSRAGYEHRALVEQERLCPGLTPQVLLHDEALALVAMELLEPHIVLRRGMIAGIVYPGFADAISTFLARTLYFTSDLALPAAEKRARAAAFAGNAALCRVTERLVFTDPYHLAATNRWTSPELDAAAAAVREDGELKRAASRLKLKFLSSAEAMLHGDLHTGSVMVTPTDTRVIDPEFAFYGPMGFDIGAVLGNLLIAFFAQDGHETVPGERDAYRDWILATVEAVWTGFRRKFLALWRENGTGDAYPPALFAGSDGERALEAERRAVCDRLLADALGFAGAKMVRRILGLAHNIDLEWIADRRVRAGCELRCLVLARRLMVETVDLTTIAAVTEVARSVRAA